MALNRSKAGLFKMHQIWNINEVEILTLETGRQCCLFNNGAKLSSLIILKAAQGHTTSQRHFHGEL